MDDKKRKFLMIGGGLVALAFFCALFLFVFEDREQLQQQLGDFLKMARGTPWALPLVCATYLVGGFIMFPVMVLNLACAVVFGLWGIGYSLVGAMLSTAAVFMAGRLVHKKHGKRFLQGKNIKKADELLNNAGVAGVIAIHSVPFPPFSIVNFAAGLSTVSFTVYMVGSLLALLPGAVARGVVGDSLTKIILNPTQESLLYLGGGILLWVVMIGGSHMLFKKFAPAPESANASA